MNELQKEILSDIKMVEIDCPECKWMESVRKAYPVKFVDPKKEYDVSYLAPHQSKSGERESGNFTLKGEDLTENQIWQLFLREAL